MMVAVNFVIKLWALHLLSFCCVHALRFTVFDVGGTTVPMRDEELDTKPSLPNSVVTSSPALNLGATSPRATELVNVNPPENQPRLNPPTQQLSQSAIPPLPPTQQLSQSVIPSPPPPSTQQMSQLDISPPQLPTQQLPQPEVPPLPPTEQLSQSEIPNPPPPPTQQMSQLDNSLPQLPTQQLPQPDVPPPPPAQQLPQSDITPPPPPPPTPQVQQELAQPIAQQPTAAELVQATTEQRDIQQQQLQQLRPLIQTTLDPNYPPEPNIPPQPTAQPRLQPVTTVPSSQFRQQPEAADRLPRPPATLPPQAGEPVPLFTYSPEEDEQGEPVTFPANELWTTTQLPMEEEEED